MTEEDFFCPEEVNKDNGKALKIRLEALIKNKGLKISKFYKSLGLTKQYWYRISNGLQNCPIELRVKIAKALDSDSSVIWKIDNSQSDRPKPEKAESLDLSDSQEKHGEKTKRNI